MAINQDWKIKSRAHVCSHSGRPFADGDEFFAAIFADPETGEFVRKDFAPDSWEALQETVEPFSFWKSLYVLPPADPEEGKVVEKESAEALLRRLVEENDAHTENAQFILAVMLERKKVLVQTDVQLTGDSRLLIYEHRKNGDVLIIRDPELKLDEVERVQAEVADLLGGEPPQKTAEAPSVSDSTDAATEAPPESDASDPQPTNE